MTNLTTILSDEPTTLNALKEASGLSLTQLSLELIELAAAGKVAVKEGGIALKQTRSYTPRSVGQALRQQAVEVTRELLAERGPASAVTARDIYEALTGTKLLTPKEGTNDMTAYRAVTTSLKSEVEAGHLFEIRVGRTRYWSADPISNEE